jgi:hypothetical protein
LRFLEVLKERPKMIPPLEVRSIGFVPREEKHTARTLHHEKRGVNPLLKTPLTFASDWEESAKVFSR